MKAASWWTGFWRLADPKLTAASVSSMLVGFAAAARSGPVRWDWLAATVAGIVSLEVAKNASGELTDFDSGADLGVAAEDRSPFSGGRRVMVDRLLTREQTRTISVATYGIGIAAGVAIAVFREPRVAWLGVAGTLLAWGYAGRPVLLAYRGFGELAVAVAYGPLICCGTYLVQRNALPAGVIALSVPPGLLIAAFLWINEFPDYRADRAAGKRNLVVRLGRIHASRWFAAILAAAFAFDWMLPAFGLPAGVRLGLAGAPFAWAAGRRLVSAPEDTPRVIPAQAWTLLSFIALSAAVAAGLLLHSG